MVGVRYDVCQSLDSQRTDWMMDACGIPQREGEGRVIKEMEWSSREDWWEQSRYESIEKRMQD